MGLPSAMPIKELYVRFSVEDRLKEDNSDILLPLAIRQSTLASVYDA